MKYRILILAITFFVETNFAQQPVPNVISEKGATPLSTNNKNQTSKNTYAVVVGISNYHDPSIPDLQFAHRDAEAFIEWLQSVSGGSLPNNQLQFLENEHATAGNIIAALMWLVEVCKPGDRAIFSFSGHGDVEQTTKSQWGYLLAYDSPKRVYPAGGAIPIPYLQEIITTLSENDVQVVVISDACHSGKLAGSTRGGPKATAIALSQQYANEVKILSCQPNEFSLEGKEWGGGRGCFSFHFLNALIGDADANNDQFVNLMETGRYLEDYVLSQTAPQSQIPMTIGNKNTILSKVYLPSLVDWKAKKQSINILSPISMKDMESSFLLKVDSTIKEIYNSFIVAMEHGDLLTPKGSSANDYYIKLINSPQMNELHGTITRNFAARLQNDAQIVLNQILANDPQTIDDAFSPVSKYDNLDSYLSRAAELLGERHYMWRFLKAREYFFRSKTLRLENNHNISADSLLKNQLVILDSALTYDPDAAYLYFEKAQLQFWSNGGSGTNIMESNLEKAMQLAPEWIMPIFLLGRLKAHRNNEQKINGIELLKKTIQLDSSFLPAYRDLGRTDKKNRKFWFEEYVRRMEIYESNNPGKVPITYYNYLGSSLSALGKNEEAKNVLLKSIELSQGKFSLLYANLGVAYCNLGEFENAEKAALKLIELSPLNSEGYNQLYILRLFYTKNKLETIPFLYQKAKQLGFCFYSFEGLIQYYAMQGNIDSAIVLASKWLEVDSVCPQAIKRLAQNLLIMGQKEEANQQFKKLLNCESSWSSIKSSHYKLIGLIKSNLVDSIDSFIETERIKVEDYPYFYFFTSCAYAFCQQNDVALDWLEKAFQKGWKPPNGDFYVHFTLFNTDLDSIRHTPRFQELVQKYLPQKVEKK